MLSTEYTSYALEANPRHDPHYPGGDKWRLCANMTTSGSTASARIVLAVSDSRDDLRAYIEALKGLTRAAEKARIRAIERKRKEDMRAAKQVLPPGLTAVVTTVNNCPLEVIQAEEQRRAASDMPF